MSYVVQSAVDCVTELLGGAGGLRTQLEVMGETRLAEALAASDYAIRGYGLKRGVVADEELSGEPRIRVQVEKLVNSRRLKYAPFSGSCKMLLNVEAAGDRQEMVAAELNVIADAVLLMLDNHVGELAEGIYYGGGYELATMPMEKSGRGFQQTAQVRFELAMDDQAGG